MSTIYDVKIPELVPQGAKGVAAVEHFNVTAADAAFTRLRAFQHGPDEIVSEGSYARLRVGSRLMMSDTWMERRTNCEFVRKAKGHVLVAGLGLGLILFTIAEKYQDVVDLVGPSVKARLGGQGRDHHGGHSRVASREGRPVRHGLL